MVEELTHMGARGIILEDQTWPKRCGHMRGKSVVPAEEHIQKIRAARDAKMAAGVPFVITARTDARGPLGIDEAIRRGNAYKAAGADLIFVEAPESLDEIKRIAREVKAPLVINNIDGGRTPHLPLETLNQLGFLSVGFVLTGLFAAARAMAYAYSHLLEYGETGGLAEHLMSFDEFTQVMGLEEKYSTDEAYANVSTS
jgi:methylisocitrate lyase